MSERTRPIIGLSSNILHPDPDRQLYGGRPLLYLEQSMATWFMRAGARPYLIPFAPRQEDVQTTLPEMVEVLDGLVLQGGSDVAPETYGGTPIQPEWAGDSVRDAFEIELVDACMKRDIPILGICRGAQLINVAFDGTLYQDIDSQVPDAIAHRDLDIYDENVHEVVFEPESRLAEIYDSTPGGRIASVHHQAIDELGDEIVVEARCPEDGLVEAIRLDRDDRYVLGVQWHPEFQDPDDASLLDPAPLLDDFVERLLDGSTG